MNINIIIVLIICFLLCCSASVPENMENTLDKLDIDTACQKISPSKLLQLFDYDTVKMIDILEKYNIPEKYITDKSQYPKIASFLKQKGEILC